MPKKTIFLIGLAALSLILGTTFAWGQSGGGFDLSWSTVDGGGGSSSGGGFTLQGTIGQPETDTLTGGGYTLSGGFWAAPPFFTIYLPLTVK